SSRRRHTRSYGDWSSDVCSSDLAACAPVQQAFLLPVNPPRLLRSSGGASRRMTPLWSAAALAAISRVLSVESSLTMMISHCWPRLEERRVGKACTLVWGGRYTMY